MPDSSRSRNEPFCELPECRHRLCVCGHAECDHADQNVQPNCADCHCARFHEIVEHGDTSPCIDRAEQALCEWEFDAGDDSVGVPWCWNCKTCGCVDINREPPSDLH